VKWEWERRHGGVAWVRQMMMWMFYEAVKRRHWYRNQADWNLPEVQAWMSERHVEFVYGYFKLKDVVGASALVENNHLMYLMG
jgi:hypothetical protein